MLDSYLDLNIGVIKKADSSRYGNGNDIPLSNLIPIALFFFFKVTTSSGKHLEDNSHAHIVSLMYKLITSAKVTIDLSFVSDRDRNGRQQELINNKIEKKVNSMF